MSLQDIRYIVLCLGRILRVPQMTGAFHAQEREIASRVTWASVLCKLGGCMHWDELIGRQRLIAHQIKGDTVITHLLIIVVYSIDCPCEQGKI